MRFRLRISLRLFITALSVACLVLGVWTHRAREQQRIVAQIERNGGWVRYDFQRSLRGLVLESNLWSALRKYLGEDYFDTIVEVETHSAVDLAELSRFPNIDTLHINISTLTDAQFVPVLNLRKLQGIDIYGDRSDPDTKIGDTSLELLAGLPALELVNVQSSRITAIGLAKLASSNTLRKLYVSSPDESIAEQAADPLRSQATHLILRRSVSDGFGKIVAQWSGGQPPGPRPFASVP